MRQKSDKGESRYQDVFGEVLLQLAQQNPAVVGITPAMASGCGMNRLAKQMPERFFDVGIEEEHAVTFAAGLAAGGMKPFCNIYSSFSQRAYDQIMHDVALQELPVVLCLDRGGLVGEDGATHHGCYDMSIYRSIPGAVIAAPKDELELKNMMYSAMLAEKGPYIIRYPRGYGEGVDWNSQEFSALEPGKGECLRKGDTIAVVCAGPVGCRAAKVADELKTETGWSPSVYNIRYVKPIDQDLIKELCENYKEIITVEDGTIIGGLYGSVCEYVATLDSDIKVKGVGIPDRYINQATQEEQRNECGLTEEKLRILFETENELFSKKD